MAVGLLRALLARRRRTLAVALAGAALHLATQLVLPLVSREALDSVIVTGRSAPLAGVVVALVVLGVVRALGAVVRRYYSTKLMAELGVELRSRLHRHVQTLSSQELDFVGVGQVMSRASSDVTLLENVTLLVPFLLQSLVAGAAGLVVLFALQPELAAAVVAVVVGVGLVTVRLAGPLHSTALDFQAAVGDFSQYVEQRVGGIRVVKGHGLEHEHTRTGDALAGAIGTHGIRHSRERAAFLAVFQLGPGGAAVAVLGIGGLLAASGSMSPGELLAFLQYLTLFAAPVMVVAQLLALWPLSVAAAGRVAEVLALQSSVSEPAAPEPLPPGPGAVSFRNVRFGYVPGHAVLDGIDLDIEAGTTLALVGRGGSGKTTLIRLLGRFHDPWEGDILLDGMPVSKAPLRELRNAVSFAFEDSILFSATIRENIAMSNPDATPGEVEEAARRARVDDFARELTGGYDAHVGEQGAELSGGQRQRLAVARALLRRARVFVLDDPTSALDPDTDEAVRAGLLEAAEGCTTIVIAHRPETVAVADRVALLVDGRVAAIGTHAELLDVPEYRITLGLEEADESHEDAEACDAAGAGASCWDAAS